MYRVIASLFGGVAVYACAVGKPWLGTLCAAVLCLVALWEAKNPPRVKAHRWGALPAVVIAMVLFSVALISPENGAFPIVWGVISAIVVYASITMSRRRLKLAESEKAE